MDGYNKALNHVLKQREKAPICVVCKVKLFDFNNCLDQYFFKLHNVGKLTMQEVNDIYTKMFYEYPFKKQDNCSLVKHHVNYILDITVNVCATCHGKIHGTNLEKYKKFKPYDKRPDPTRFDTYTQR